MFEAQASAALEHWVQDHPEVEREIKETVRAHFHLQELERRAREADQAQEAAEQGRSTGFAGRSRPRAGWRSALASWIMSGPPQRPRRHRDDHPGCCAGLTT